MKMDQTECSETSAYKIQTQGNYPEKSIQHSEHGESMKSEGSSSGRRLNIQHNRLPTRLLILMHAKRTVPYLYTQPSSWR